MYVSTCTSSWSQIEICKWPAGRLVTACPGTGMRGQAGEMHVGIPLLVALIESTLIHSVQVVLQEADVKQLLNEVWESVC